MSRRRRPPRPGSLTDLNPITLLKQIVFLQVAYYATALILLVFTALAAGKHFTLNFLLDWRTLRGDITEGWMLGLVWMLNSLIMVIFLLILIARSKLIPDFTLTIHFLNLLVTSFYTRSIPTFIFWWFLQVASILLMTSLGIWSCQWRELKPILFGAKADTAASIVAPGTVQRSRPDPSVDPLGGQLGLTSNDYEMGAMKERGG